MQQITAFIYLYFACFTARLNLVFLRKALVIVIHFLPFKGTTPAYLLKLSITHNQNRIPLLNLLINCISAKSASQILSLKDDHPFRFSNLSPKHELSPKEAGSK